MNRLEGDQEEAGGPSGWEISEPAFRAGKPPRWLGPAQRQRLVVLGLLFMDVVLGLFIWGVAVALQDIWGRGPLSGAMISGIIPVLAVWIGLRALLGLYPGYGLDEAEQLRRQTYALFSALAITSVFAVASQTGDSVSRLLLLGSFLGLLVAAPPVRHLAKLGLIRAGVWGKPVIVLGDRANGARLVNLLRRERHLGFEPIGIFDDGLTPRGENREVAEGDTLEYVVDLGREREIDTAIFATPHTRREHLAGLVSRASTSFRHVVVTPNLGGITNSAVVARDFSGTLGVEIKHNLLDRRVQRIKRGTDLIFTALGGLLVFPLLLGISLLIRLESGGPVFYRDVRLGRDGKSFSCVKFRTMANDAEALLQSLLKEDPEAREEYLKYHKLRRDPRVTRVGRLLRKTSLDELPQVWNVLRGEMSLVGPRPYLPRESDDIGELQNEILRVRPGISGLWQVTGRSRTSFGERVQMDSYYVRNWSIWLDVVILARTVTSVLFSRDAY